MSGYCTRCGGQLVDGDQFCTGCGARRPVDHTVSVGPDPTLPLSLPSLNVVAEDLVDALAISDESLRLPPPPGGESSSRPSVPINVRAMSWGIDAAIVAIAFVVASSIQQLLGVVVLVAGTSAYYVMMLNGPWRGTVGHRVVGLAVLDEESREPIGPRTAGLRLAINSVLAIPFGLGLLLNVPMLKGSAGRTVHDVGSGTIVVSTK